jgi:ATP/maltotriose-dependent transcriptional regulator MalT/DNA-binding SARP family transcriptional activator
MVEGLRYLANVEAPLAPADALRRPRLLDLLGKLQQHKLVLITAPAGFGKSLLAASLAQESRTPAAWLTLDATYTEPAQLLAHLVAAFQHAFAAAAFGTDTLAALDTAATSGALVQALSLLAAELHQAAPEGVLLMLDDVHTVQGYQPVLDLLDLFIQRSPAGCRLLLLGRTPPALPSIPRLVAHGHAARVPASELLFTADEVAQVVARHGIKPVGADFTAFVEGFGGWPAGITLSLASADGLLPQAAAGSDGLVSLSEDWVEYVQAEVISGLPDTTQDFLRRSSVLHDLRPAHADAILNTTNTAALLKSLAGSLDLVQKVTGQPGDALQYRYHPLFRAVLVQTLSDDPDAFTRVHQTAAQYFAGQELWDAAIAHFCAIGAYAEAAQTVERAARDVYQSGQWARLASWIDRIPEGVYDRYPLLLIHRARTAVQLGQAEKAMALSSRSLDLLHEGPDEVLAQAHVSRAAAFRLQGLLDRCIDECERAIRLIGEQRDRVSRLTLAESYHYQGNAYAQGGRYVQAQPALERALELYWEDGDLYHIAAVHHNLGGTQRALGDFAKAAAHYTEAQAGWMKLGNTSSLASTLNNLGNLYLHEGRLQEAEETLLRAAHYGLEAGATRVVSHIFNTLGDTAGLLGDYGRALGYYQDSVKAAREASEHKNVVLSTEGMALAHLAQGDAMTAYLVIEEARALVNPQSGDEVLARVLTSQGVVARTLGQYQQARDLFDQAVYRLQGAGKAAGSFVTQARTLFHVAELRWDQRQDGVNPLLATVATLLDQPGTEMALLTEARLRPSFVQYAANQDASGPLFRRVQAALQGLGSLGAMTAVSAAAVNGDATPAAGSALETSGGVQVRAYTLGETRVEVTDPAADVVAAEVAWPTEKTKELFFFLLLRDDWVHKDEIVEALWPEADPGKGDTTFWTTASRLRRAVHAEVLVRSGSLYRLNPALGYWLDLWSFEQGMDAGLTQRESSAEGERGQRLQTSLNLYKGPFLRETYAEWAEPVRQRAQDRYLGGLQELARLWLAKGVAEKAVALCDMALEVDGYQVEAHLVKMQALAQGGRLAEADRAFQRYVKVVTEELDEEPEERVVALHRQVMQGRLSPNTTNGATGTNNGAPRRPARG